MAAGTMPWAMLQTNHRGHHGEGGETTQVVQLWTRLQYGGGVMLWTMPWTRYWGAAVN